MEAADTVLFDTDDVAYLDWLKDHREGFVLNTRRGDVSTAKLHLASCSHIRDLRHFEHSGGFTERAWVKLCSDRIEPLLERLRSLSQGGMVREQRCRSCSVHENELLLESDARELNAGSIVPFTVQVSLNRYERDPLLRFGCLAHHGHSCSACRLEFDMRYGPVGEGFMDVHLTRDPLDITDQRPVDPTNDLIPVCPNCHAMLHRGVPVPRTIAELQRLMGRAIVRRTRDVSGPIG